MDAPGPEPAHAGPANAQPEKLADLVERGFQVEYHNHARAVLNIDFPAALDELQTVLRSLVIPVESLVRGGGGEHDLTQGLRRSFNELHWRKHNFEIKKLVDGVARESISHEVDHVRRFDNGNVAMEIEWNNKDPFYDRDLENFKRLHAEAAISVGVIITRGRSLHGSLRRRILKFAEDRNISAFPDLAAYDVNPTTRQRNNVESRVSRGTTFAASWSSWFVADKFGEATTHWDKLEARVRRGVGNPCPLLLIGIPEEVLVD